MPISSSLNRLLAHRTPSLQLVVSLMLCLTLTSCSIFRPSTPTALDANWSVEGKISLRTADDAETINFKWQQLGANYLIDLWGPLGQGATQIQKEAGIVTLRRGDEIIDQAFNAEQLLRQTTGWQLPVTQLQYWARGQLAPGRGQRTLNAEQQLQTIKQNGWVIEYLRLHQDSGWPALIVARYGEQLTVKMVFRNWHFADAAMTTAYPAS
ncbi:outer membrane lipoprotein LolB [bacterium]|nr:outer membrane lipoprotein LolB [bacterium]